jgi:tetratricopeptide (TPR) repeat protein
VVQFLKEKRSRRESQKRQERLAEIATRVAVLTAKGSHREAVALVSGFIKESGEDPEAVRLLRETQESWSTLLEARSEERVSSGDRDKLEEAVKSLEQARTLTSKVERLVVLQQKLSSIQLALSRQDTSRKIQRTYDLLKSGKHQEVLDQLASTNLDGLSDRDRDLFHYLRGAASFALGQWTAAAKSFSFLVQRNFENLDVLHGLALVRSGQETAGMAILVNIPPEGRTDEVNRVLGFNFAERGEYSKAVVHLAALKNPTPADLEMLLKTRRELGADAYRHNEYARAAEEFQAARQIIEVQLHRRAADVYLYLGNSYYRLDDFERAKKAYQDLGNMDLTASERDQMKELFLFRGQIRLREKNPDAAYQDFSEFVRLGGQLPADVVNIYGRLVATYANYMPLEKIHYWNYTSTAKDYNYTLVVKEGSGGQYSVERREGGNASTEGVVPPGHHAREESRGQRREDADQLETGGGCAPLPHVHVAGAGLYRGDRRHRADRGAAGGKEVHRLPQTAPQPQPEVAGRERALTPAHPLPRPQRGRGAPGDLLGRQESIRDHSLGLRVPVGQPGELNPS